MKADRLYLQQSEERIARLEEGVGAGGISWGMSWPSTR